MPHMDLVLGIDGDLVDLLTVQQSVIGAVCTDKVSLSVFKSTVESDQAGLEMVIDAAELPDDSQLVSGLDMKEPHKRRLLQVFGDDLTVGVLRNFSSKDLCEIPYLGPVSVGQIEAAVGGLAEHSSSILERNLDISMYDSLYYDCPGWYITYSHLAEVKTYLRGMTVREFALKDFDNFDQPSLGNEDQETEITRDLRKAWNLFQPLRDAAIEAHLA